MALALKTHRAVVEFQRKIDDAAWDYAAINEDGTIPDGGGQLHQPENRRNNEIISNFSDCNTPQMLKHYRILCPIPDSEVWAGIWAAK